MHTNPALPRRHASAPLPCHAAILIALLALAPWASATEGGGSSYPIGADTTLSGYMLPEGANWLLFYQFYSAPHFKDARGNNTSRLTSFRLRSNVVAPRLSYVWPNIRFLGATIETRIVQPIANVDLTLDVARPSPLPPLNRGGVRTGLADLSLSPVILGWHSATYHQTIGLESHLKTGSYDVHEPVNTGRNHMQIAPVYAFTWFPRPRLNLSAKFRYGINGTNKATQYDSGDEASVEFSAGYQTTSQLLLGVNGYIYRQTTDDRQNGERVNGDGNRGRVNALGPYASYRFGPGIAAIVRVQAEFGARNRPEGTRVWAMMFARF